MRPYIGIEGPIGVGKTTLATYLSHKLKADLMLEVFEENPFLPRFYEDPACYALQTQLFFLMSRYRQHEKIRGEGGVLVSDYLFAKNDLFARYTLTGEEHTLYSDISNTLAAHLIPPTLVVLLRADIDTLMARIEYRGRDYEQKASMRDYVARLAEQYDRFFADYTAAPVLVLNTSQINIVEDVQSRQALMERIVDEFDQIMADQPLQTPLL
jgi:deoxyguanosine kinase